MIIKFFCKTRCLAAIAQATFLHPALSVTLSNQYQAQSLVTSNLRRVLRTMRMTSKSYSRIRRGWTNHILKVPLHLKVNQLLALWRTSHCKVVPSSEAPTF